MGCIKMRGGPLVRDALHAQLSSALPIVTWLRKEMPLEHLMLIGVIEPDGDGDGDDDHDRDDEEEEDNHDN